MLQVPGLSYEDWTAITGLEASLTSQDGKWQFGDNMDITLLEVTYLGYYEGKGQETSTQEKIYEEGGLNDLLEESLENTPAYLWMYREILEEWLEENNKNPEDLTYEDYINMDTDVIEAIHHLTT